MSIALASATMLMPSISHAKVYCHASDPTGTPLNVRSAPNGQVIGKLRNGDYIFVLDWVLDSKGREWAKIAYDTQYGTTEAYAFGNYIKCKDY